MSPKSSNPDSLAILEDESGYRGHFLDLERWRPYVQAVCKRHGLAPTIPLQTGVAGTYPVFIAGGRWVVKFFGRLFDGEQSFRTELELTGLANRLADFPAPRLVASGELFPQADGWRWPYLVLEYLPGTSFGEIGSILGRRVRLQLAHELGCLGRRIHSLPAASWELYLQFLAGQRAACRARLEAWGWMPANLLDELESYLLPPQALIDPGERPHWIHADLTRDHLIGRWEHGDWNTLGLIDFGDGRIGSLYYELAALHLDFFEGDGRLLSAFLEAYGYSLPQDEAFRRKALTASLLHPFDVLGPYWRKRLEFCPPTSLGELALRVWGQGPITD